MVNPTPCRGTFPKQASPSCGLECAVVLLDGNNQTRLKGRKRVKDGCDQQTYFFLPRLVTIQLIEVFTYLMASRT